jgi:hypothetical protein
MSQIIGRWAFTILGSEAEELIKDRAGDQPIVVAPGNVRRLVGGPGWRVDEDGGGYTIVIEYSPEECDALAAGEAERAEVKRVEEERLREESRASREIGQPSIRGPR